MKATLLTVVRVKNFVPSCLSPTVVSPCFERLKCQYAAYVDINLHLYLY
jgi:hypothetical protein